MKPTATLRNIIVITALFLITYALAKGIRNDNTLGIVLALGSMMAFFVCIYLFEKLVRDEVTGEE